MEPLLSRHRKAVSEIYAPFKTINVEENAPAWVNGEYLSHVDETKHLSKQYKKTLTLKNLVLKQEAIVCTNELRLHLQQNFFKESI